ncbi:MAG TPA: acetyl-CoA carboxylase biotin carboxyl carrier protein subunit [Thermotogota bacterium]|mgnify:CR=1 FL=1|nr:acetyl-CoA carboxylase biotin carboxyl carrier protein subunit [Thermotogota bacterium]HRW93470.1 acetyl-CoA carboxylase biotin carboxyl carrier protein subunit [Thermotogota bacterium]
MKKYRVWVNGESFEVEVEELEGSDQPEQAISSPSRSREVEPSRAPRESTPPKKSSSQEKSSTAPKGSGGFEVIAPMAGLVIDVFAQSGKQVSRGDKLLVLEAMKMENEIISEREGVIDAVNVRKGENVETGTVMMTIIPSK